MTSMEQPEPDDHEHVWFLTETTFSGKGPWSIHFYWQCKCRDTFKSTSIFKIGAPKGTKDEHGNIPSGGA